MSRRQHQPNSELEATVRNNTVITFANMHPSELVDAADRYSEDQFMLGLVGEAATTKLVDVNRQHSDDSLRLAAGGKRDFDFRLSLLGYRTTLEDIQRFAQGRSEHPPIQF